jgi:hypothetical protein
MSPEPVDPDSGEQAQNQRGDASYRREHAHLGGRSVERHHCGQGNGYETYLGAKLGDGVRRPQPQEVTLPPEPRELRHLDSDISSQVPTCPGRTVPTMCFPLTLDDASRSTTPAGVRQRSLPEWVLRFLPASSWAVEPVPRFRPKPSPRPM